MNIQVFHQEQVDQLKELRQPLLGITCLLMTIKWRMKILYLLVMSLTDLY